MYGGLDAAFQVCGPAFVEPEVLPRCVGDEIATPCVGELMCDDVYVLSVTGDDGRSGEGVDGIFHPAVRERGWKDEHVVSRPGVGVDDLLRGTAEVFGGTFEFPFRGLQFFWTRPDAGSRTYSGRCKVSGRKSEEVAWHWDALMKGVEKCAWFAVLAGLEVS